MITGNKTDTLIDVTLDAEIEVASACQARDALLAAVAEASPARPARIDLSDAPPRAPALQLANAARRSLEARGAFAGYGPRAALLLPQ